ncbi:MAG: hypothetical protein ACK5W1_04880 [Flavobacteriales bacterium]
MRTRTNPTQKLLRWWLKHKILLMDMIRDMDNKIYRHETTQRAINKELQEINTMLPLLRENHAAMPDGELRDLTAQRIAALELRAYTLSTRTPEFTDEYIEQLRNNLPKQRELLAAAEEKIEELKGKLKGG